MWKNYDLNVSLQHLFYSNRICDACLCVQDKVSMWWCFLYSKEFYYHDESTILRLEYFDTWSDLLSSVVPETQMISISIKLQITDKLDRWVSLKQNIELFSSMLSPHICWRRLLLWCTSSIEIKKRSRQHVGGSNHVMAPPVFED